MSTYVYNPNQYTTPAPGQGEIIGGQNAANMFLYQLKGKPAFGYVDIHLQANQKVVTEGNSLLWMNDKIDAPTTECWGGCCDAFLRSLSNEKCCFNTYTNNTSENQKISIGFNDPGDLLTFGCSKGSGWLLTRGAFLAGTDNLRVKGRCIGCCTGLVGGEGLFLTTVTVDPDASADTGVFVAGSFGALVRHDIPQGKVLWVSRGLFFAAHENTRPTIALAGGLKNLCCSGAAIVLQFYGPSVVYTQSRDPEKWNPLKQAQKERKKGGGGGGGDGGGDN